MGPKDDVRSRDTRVGRSKIDAVHVNNCYIKWETGSGTYPMTGPETFPLLNRCEFSKGDVVR